MECHIAQGSKCTRDARFGIMDRAEDTIAILEALESHDSNRSMNTPLVITSVIAAGLIFIAIFLAVRARRLAVQDAIVLEDELSEFQQMFEAGEINEEEFLKMKKIIATKAVQRAKQG